MATGAKPVTHQEGTHVWSRTLDLQVNTLLLSGSKRTENNMRKNMLVHLIGSEAGLQLLKFRHPVKATARMLLDGADDSVWDTRASRVTTTPSEGSRNLRYGTTTMVFIHMKTANLGFPSSRYTDILYKAAKR